MLNGAFVWLTAEDFDVTRVIEVTLDRDEVTYDRNAK